ncbi:signal peptide peptidase SppA [Kurthia sibirica]|uniref:Signal peptide peptidase SppA n=1 Tax=Kurthia sibirica TaxID=202750 RepID=A0A2U3ANU5_9BACL|nr:signal peptide peptidase SppA [Kurthia sibirica]PWI26218.1 signal peptide peptidase SppA [Kurthia sibirica]GEK34732.1 peptidase [Kurthia sibirica]
MNTKRWVALGAAVVLLFGSILISALINLSKSNFAGQFEKLTSTSLLESNMTRKTIEEGSNTSQIALLKVDGTIQDTGDTTSILGSNTGYNHQQFLKQLDDIKADTNVKGVVLSVNSPGGGVVESKQVYEKIKAIQDARKIPIYVSMGSMAASGGYYISAPADKIFVDEETLTGSIGVIMQAVNYSELADKYGVSFETIKTGPYKDIMSGSRKMTEGDRKILQSMVDDSYKRFLNVVADGRDLPMAAVKKVADGRVMNGSQAVKAGLADDFGYTADAIAALKQDKDMKGSKVFEYNTQDSISSLFSTKVSSLFGASAETQAITKLLSNYNNAPRMMYMYGAE